MDKTTPEQLGFIVEEDGAIKIDDVYIPGVDAPALTTDVPESRLIIESLVITNFKSYAGQQNLGPFNKNFTSVVGPNGSGKSNVIDSLLFVLGHKSRKIRSKKLSNLIHKSDQYPNLNSCSVQVNFYTINEKGDEVIIDKDSRFSLSRTAFKDDTSYYQMNQKRVQFKEVTKVLRKYGIDLEHNRFLILQGEIEAIAQMQPLKKNDNDKGMLEYIEDVIGTNRFIEPIEIFKQKVDKLNEERKLMLSQLKLFEKEKDELEAPKNAAIEYLRSENKLAMAENKLFHLRRYETERALEEATESKKKFMEEMKAFKTEMEKVKTSKKALEASLSAINSEYDSVQKTVEEKTEEFSKLEVQDASNCGEIKNMKQKIANLAEKLESAKAELAKLNKQSVVYQQETEELQKKKQKMEEDKEVDEKKMEEVMGSLQQETLQLQEKKDKIEAELLKLKNKSYQIKSDMDLTQSELNILNSGGKREQEKLKSLNDSCKKASQAASNEEKSLKSEREKLQITEEEINNYIQQLEDLRMNEENLTYQLKTDRMKLQELRSNASTTSRNVMVQAFLKEKARGRLTGVYGRLGDLGAIDPKYDVAMSTACFALNNIVTDTMNTAQECVKYLKEHNLGYTTFIALDKMKKYEPYVNTKISTPENVPRLFDLIKVKDRSVLPAFYYGLSNTLVANDLEQATRIGLQGTQRYRVVTLKGELIDLAGTMSGGGGTVKRGLMGQAVVDNSVTPEMVNEMSAQVEDLTRKLSTIKKHRMNVEEALSQKKSIISALHHSLKKRLMNYNAHKESLKVLSIQIQEQESKIKATVVDQNKVKALEAEIKEKSKEYTKAVEEESGVEQTVARIQAELLQISKGKFQKYKKNLSQTEKKLAEITQALTKSTVNMKTAKRNSKKVEDKIKSIEIDIQKHRDQVVSLKGIQDSLTVEGQKLNLINNELKEKLQKLKEEKAELKKECDAIVEKEHKLKLDEIELKNKLKTYESSEAEKRSIIKAYTVKISKLKLAKVEDDLTELQTLTEEEIKRLSASSISSDIDSIKIQLEEMNPNLSAIQDFNTKLKMYDEKQKEVDELNVERTLQQKRYDYLNNRRINDFMKGFTIIAMKLKETYQMLTIGGDAEIELIDNMNPFTKGIEFSVRPPKKSWKFMRNLSGGEKTLSSLALVFALHYYRPTPFYVMDEIDAALDVRNVSIVGFYLKEMTKNTQFIIVSLRNVMNENSDHLLGIYKINNCTKSLSISDVHKWYPAIIRGA